jgi:hypothetical protein
VGGWRFDLIGVLEAAGNIAVVMAEAHLRSGSDVVMPQLETSVAEAERFEQAARGAGAEYVDIAMTVEPEKQGGASPTTPPTPT